MSLSRKELMAWVVPVLIVLASSLGIRANAQHCSNQSRYAGAINVTHASGLPGMTANVNAYICLTPEVLEVISVDTRALIPLHSVTQVIRGSDRVIVKERGEANAGDKDIEFSEGSPRLVDSPELFLIFFRSSERGERLARFVLPLQDALYLEKQLARTCSHEAD